MKVLVHFAKIFAIAWVLITILYFIALLRGMDISVGVFGNRHVSLAALRMLLYVWPVIPALIIASFWEVVRTIRLRIARLEQQH